MIPCWLVGTFACRATQNLVPSQKRESTDMGSACRKSEMASETFDVIVCKSQDLEEDQPKEVKLLEQPPTSALLVKHGGQIHAVSNKCTHYGAPLIKGSFCAKRGIVRCPWHGACFNIANGDIEDFPGLKSLKSYDIKVDDDDNVHVSGSHGPLLEISTIDCSDPRTVVIVGGGAAGQVCAETLRTRRKNPWKGRIILITQETNLPYDRPKLSKVMTASGSDLQLRPQSFYADLDIQTKLGGNSAFAQI